MRNEVSQTSRPAQDKILTVTSPSGGDVLTEGHPAASRPQKTGASQVPAPQAAGLRSPEGLGRVTQSPGATHLCQRQGTRPNRPSSAKHAHTGSVWSVCLLQQAEVLSLGPFLWGGRGSKTYETISVKGNAFLFLLTVVRC